MALGEGHTRAWSLGHWKHSDPTLQEIGRWGGPAAALAWFCAHSSDCERFALAVGPSLMRGLPSAVRAVVMGYGPLDGRLREGQVGSDLGARLAPVADVLAMHGSVRANPNPRDSTAQEAADQEGGTSPGWVLKVDTAGPTLHCLPSLQGANPQEKARVLRETFGPCASLCIGPAGEARLPMANLAAGEDPVCFVGRGGLGTALAQRGLQAIVLTSDPFVGKSESSLREKLQASPRLAARSEGGSLELFDSLAASQGRAGREPASLELTQARVQRRHGCAGCPTPCGWISDTDGEIPVSARFNALAPLGSRLGLDEIEDARTLLDECNRLGIDAKEAGRGLSVLVRADPTLHGSTQALSRLLRQAVAGKGAGAVLRQGAAALADAEGDEHPDPSPASGLGPDITRDLAARVGLRGGEPMRTFPFLMGTGMEITQLAELTAPLPLPSRAADPVSSEGKGRLVWWHENLILALDQLGFCSFAAAGLLADGVMNTEQLGAALGLSPRDPSLIEMGANLGNLWMRVQETCGLREDSPGAVPPLAQLGTDPQAPMEHEYWTLRVGGRAATADGCAGGDAVVERALAALRETVPPEMDQGQGVGSHDSAAPLVSGPRSTGRVCLRSGGALGRLLEGTGPPDLERRGVGHLSMPLPASVGEVIAQAAAQWPGAAPLLVNGGRVLPGVYRAGGALGVTDSVHEGDDLDLVLVVSGG